MKFEEAAEAVKNLQSRPSDAELLDLYAFYKQATVGDCNTEKPGLLDLKGKYKWEEWNKLKGMAKEVASEKYVQYAEKLIQKYGVKA